MAMLFSHSPTTTKILIHKSMKSQNCCFCWPNLVFYNSFLILYFYRFLIINDKIWPKKNKILGQKEYTKQKFALKPILIIKMRVKLRIFTSPTKTRILILKREIKPRPRKRTLIISIVVWFHQFLGIFRWLYGV